MNYKLATLITLYTIIHNYSISAMEQPLETALSTSLSPRYPLIAAGLLTLAGGGYLYQSGELKKVAQGSREALSTTFHAITGDEDTNNLVVGVAIGYGAAQISSGNGFLAFLLASAIRKDATEAACSLADTAGIPLSYFASSSIALIAHWAFSYKKSH